MIEVQAEFLTRLQSGSGDGSRAATTTSKSIRSTAAANLMPAVVVKNDLIWKAPASKIPQDSLTTTGSQAAFGRFFIGNYMTDLPKWYVAAIKEIGTRELPENRGPAIRRYIKLARCGAEGEPWCAVFANAMLESVGISGTGSALARSFEKSPNFVKLAGPALGAIVTFWRQSKSSGLGHVGFYAGEKMGRIYALGGNEGDMVQVEPFGESAHFGRSGFYWPKSVALPNIGVLPPQLPAGASASGKVV